MKKHILVLVAFLILTGIVITTALAAPIVSEDTYTDVANGNTNYDGIGSMFVSSSGLSCENLNQEAFLKFDLSIVSNTVGNDASNPTRLQFDVLFGQGAGSLNLHAVANDSWNETTLTHNTPKPTRGPVLASIPLPTTPGTYSFSSAALASYINQESAYAGDGIVGDNTASFSIVITGCVFVGNVQIFEKPGMVGGPSGGSPAELILFTPTAVRLDDFSASKSPYTNTQLIIAGGAALVLVSGVLYLLDKRRRAS